MMDAVAGETDKVENALVEGAAEMRTLIGEASLRLGIVDRSPEYGDGDGGGSASRTVDAAVEVTLAASRATGLPEVARSLFAVIGSLAEPGSVEVMAGPMFPMVPQRDGGSILSLAFSRYPGTTSQQFRDWWRLQHAPLAIRVLGPGLLAYDQVHVDHVITVALAEACGIAAYPYDAYDNLTWASPSDFLASLTDADGMAELSKDETGRIDNDTRRSAMLRRIG